MHKKFLSIVCCPETGEDLKLEIIKRENDLVIEGSLISATRSYPIIRGIPRFVESDTYAKSFGWQWNRWSRIQFEEENVGRPMEGHTTRMWERITSFSNAELNNAFVLDVGCGPGRFSDVARRKGAVVVGIDFSSAVEAAAKNFAFDENVLIVQGDALKLPFKSDVFDFVFSIGVLHHTPSPSVGVEEAFRVLKKGGQFGVCVYGKGGYYDFPTVQLWRRVFKTLWPYLGHYPPLIYSYITTYLFRPIARTSRVIGLGIRLFFPFVNLPDKRWSLLDTFDSVTPSYQSAHESFEVWSWLKKVGFGDIQPTDWGFTAFRGKKD